MIILICAFALALVPLSDCYFGIASIYGVATSGAVNKGTCGYYPVASQMPGWWQAGYISAPDEELYDGYPFLSGPELVDVGFGKSCGECFELTGPLQTIRVMVSDICDKGTNSNCQGVLGGPLGGPNYPMFDVDDNVFAAFAGRSGGEVMISWRKVACDINATLSVFFNSAVEGLLSLNPLRFVLYAVCCMLYAVRCTLCAVRCALYAVRCALYAVRCTLYAVRCTLYAVRCTLHAARRVLCGEFSILMNLRFACMHKQLSHCIIRLFESIHSVLKFTGTPQPTYFRLRPFNHVVGISSVQVKSSLTNDQWTPLQRHWEGNFNWTGRGKMHTQASTHNTLN
jgi:hypothetical protein